MKVAGAMTVGSMSVVKYSKSASIEADVFVLKNNLIEVSESPCCDYHAVTSLGLWVGATGLDPFLGDATTSARAFLNHDCQSQCGCS